MLINKKTRQEKKKVHVSWQPGKPLGSIDRMYCIAMARDMKIPFEKIAEALQMPIEAIKQIHKMTGAMFEDEIRKRKRAKLKQKKT